MDSNSHIITRNGREINTIDSFGYSDGFSCMKQYNQEQLLEMAGFWARGKFIVIANRNRYIEEYTIGYNDNAKYRATHGEPVLDSSGNVCSGSMTVVLKN